MSSHFMTTSLIEDLKRRAALPTSQATFTDQDLVDFMNDEMESILVPMIMSIREGFFVQYKDFTITSTTSSFEIPDDAIGMRLRDVVLVDNVGGDEQYTNLPQLTLEQISAVGLRNSGTGNFGYYGFYIEGNSVKLYPAQSWAQSTLRLYYFKRPGRLVLANATSTVTAIDSGTNIITLALAPTSWTITSTLDIINPLQPFYNNVTDLSISAISGNDITVSSVTDITVGDIVALHNESPIPQIPVEGHPILLQLAEIKILESLNDDRNWKLAVDKYKQMTDGFMKVITPRVDGQYKKVVSRNNIFGYINQTGSW